MSQHIVSSFDLNRLRGSFAEQFRSWDEAVRTADTSRARLARSTILTTARASLNSDPAACLPGVYVFFDRHATGLWPVRYIGVAHTVRRPIAERIIDRLRDDSGLDTALDAVNEQDFKRKVLGRLLVALPGTGQNYVDKHYRVAQLFRASTDAILVGGEFVPADIRQAERSLIGSCAAGGADLRNRTHLRFRGKATGNAAKIASCVISACEQFGLSREAASQWLALAVEV